MDEHWSIDRFEQPIKVGDTVTVAYNDALRGGVVVYLASPSVAELVVEIEGDGLLTIGGETDHSNEGSRYANVIVNQ